MAIWEKTIPKMAPRRILEIGSNEGRSACYLVDKLAPIHSLELHCVDPWRDIGDYDMRPVEERFKHNLRVAMSRALNAVELVVHKQNSDEAMVKLLAEGKANSFDMAYIDGSHIAADVLSDAVLAFKLVKVGGYMIFDDYIWKEPGKPLDMLNCPKAAVDTFANLYVRKVQFIDVPIKQVFLRKTEI